MNMQEYKLFWGDSHTNIHSRHMDSLQAILDHARALLDFWPIAYYPQEYKEKKGFRYEDWLEEDRVEREWRAICDLAAENDRPGEFVIFPGYEWQGDGRWGDHNVFYLEDHGPLIRVNSLPELYREIRRRGLKAFAIPHHTAYIVGIRGKNWDIYDGELSPFAEIYSNHGCSESDEEWIGLRANRHMGPGVSGGTIEEALDRGYRLGIVCSTDNHTGSPGFYGSGLMACYAKALTREALWEAFSERRVYGVTGDRIELSFTVEGAPMGSYVHHRGSVHIEVDVRGCDALDRIELLRNNTLIAGYFHSGRWSVPEGDDRILFKLRLEVGWGPTPEEASGLPPREWEGYILVPEGRIVSVERCWRSRGQWSEGPGGGTCRFGFRTGGHGPEGKTPSEALIFEIEARPSDRVEISLEGKELRFTVAEAMKHSRVLFFPDEVKASIRDTYGLDPELLPRDDPFYFLSHKAKVHRAVPEAGYHTSWEHTDPSPPRGVNHYRVRVHQRNGQVAWSSPIWVINE